MDIMKTILELEQKVRNLNDSETELLQTFDEETKQEISRMKAEVDERLRMQDEANRKKQEQEREKELKLLDKKYQEETARLHEVYQKKKEKWTDEITMRILSV